MTQELWIGYLFPSLNDFIAELKKYRLTGQRMKTKLTTGVAWEAKAAKLQPYDGPVRLTFTWHEAKANRDPDNIVFAKKFILDGLVTAGILKNDTQKYIKGFTDGWVVGSGRIGVHVLIEGVEDDRHVNRKSAGVVHPLDNDALKRLGRPDPLERIGGDNSTRF